MDSVFRQNKVAGKLEDNRWGREMLLSKRGRIYNIRDNLMIIMIRWVTVSIKPRQKKSRQVCTWKKWDSQSRCLMRGFARSEEDGTEGEEVAHSIPESASAL